MKKLFLFAIITITPLLGKAPQMTVVIVIDQFSWHYIPKLKPYLTGGIKLLTQEGVNYTNAFYDHSMPGTGPGHTMLTTGTYGCFHGIINNKWWNNQGTLVLCDDDTAQNAAVFAPHGKLYTYGKSARNCMVDNLSDQLIMHSYPHARNTVWSLSLKSRAAIAMAGRLGKALWFDDMSGNFTSSKAYFKQLPDWVKAFNEKYKIDQTKQFTWKPFYPCDSKAYAFKDINNYAYSSSRLSLIGRECTIDPAKGFDEEYNKTPLSNQNLINLAINCIEKNYSGKKNDRFILWLSLSSLDKVAHDYGPRSKEALDMIYHMDAQLKQLIDYIYSRVKKEDTLIVLTADHGIQPIPEMLRDEGLDIARRYNFHTLIADLNKLIEKKYALKKYIQHYKEPQFYFDQKLMASLSCELQAKINADIKKHLLNLPGIRRCWTFDELQKTIFADYDLDKFLQRQLFKGRSGQVIFAVEPYTTIDTHSKGTSHITEYAYDTQVPLIFYQSGRFMKKNFAQNVYIPQVPVTLATILEVPRPSAAAGNILPGLRL